MVSESVTAKLIYDKAAIVLVQYVRYLIVVESSVVRSVLYLCLFRSYVYCTARETAHLPKTRHLLHDAVRAIRDGDLIQADANNWFMVQKGQELGQRPIRPSMV